MDMQVSALLTSAGINIAICMVLFSFYSVLRKQPSNRNVYFARKLAQMRSKRHDPHWFERFVPSPGWILKAWATSEDVILTIGGLDAVVFIRMVVFSIRIFSIAAIICISIVLPLNYYGQEVEHKVVAGRESLTAFTTQNVKEGSRWLWAHCLALYIISFSACILLHFETKSIIRRRLMYVKRAAQNLSQFAVLVRGIPWSAEESYDTTLKNYFTKYYPSTYLSQQIVYRCGKIQKLMKSVQKVYDFYRKDDAACVTCTYSGGRPPFNMLVNEPEVTGKEEDMDLHSYDLHTKGKECSSGFVFFKTRYAASCVAQGLQSSNPMLWVTNSAPEPGDVYWRNLGIPYKQLWLRRTATLLATAAFLVFFIAPVTLVQSLANLTQLRQMFPFMEGVLKKKLATELVTGYIPSVILVLFFYTVPPLMMLFSTIEGAFSRSKRKMAACSKILSFTIWNVFFINIISGTVLNRLDVFSNPKNIPLELAARAVPAAVNFFMSYVFTSGWTSLACELVQLFPLIGNFFFKKILMRKTSPFDGGYTFPYHTELPRLLLFGLFGFNFAVLAPLILPLLLIYFSFAYLIYRNQIINVYKTEYDSGGQYWPIIHNTTMFSLLLSQIIAAGVFTLKKSTVCLGFTIVLAIFTLLYSVYWRRRFALAFHQIASEVLIDLDQHDEQIGRLEEVYQMLPSSYSQLEWMAYYDNVRSTVPYSSLDDESIRCAGESDFSQELKPDHSGQSK